MKKIIFTSLIFFALFLTNEINAQKYNMAAGFRGGYGINLTLKKFISDNNAIEGYVGVGSYSGFLVGAQYQKHSFLEGANVPNLDWYWGFGAYLGTWGSYGFGNDYFFLGPNLNIGLDYVFPKLPLNISVDWMPGINIIKGDYASTLHLYGGGFSVRYILGE